MTSYIAVIQSSLLEKLNKNNFISKIDNMSKEYIIYSDKHEIFFVFICNDIEMQIKISNYGIYRNRSDLILEDLLDNQEKLLDFESKHLRLKIEEKSLIFLLKISSSSKNIIIKIEDNLSKICFLYKNKNTIINVETDQQMQSTSYDFNFYNRKEEILTQILSEDFSDIIVAHQSISDNKIVNDDNQNIQIKIHENKIKFLSTNYVVGLIQQISKNEDNNDSTLQFQINKNIDILKIYQIFKLSDYVLLIQGDNKHDCFGRVRSQFIKFLYEDDICYVRLYKSDINTFDETVIDDQIDLENKYLVNKSVILDIVNTIKNSFEIKKIDIIEIKFKLEPYSVLSQVICKSLDYNFNFESTFNQESKNHESAFKIKLSGSTMSTIYQILNRLKKIETLSIFTSVSGEQGKINHLSEYETNIIFV